ncbi:MAG: ribosome silencing factor [Candidatus Neomarinimicrobiota bacterium]
MSTPAETATPTDLATKVADLMLDKHGSDIMVMDLRGVTSVTDYFVLCSCDSDVQVKAVVGHLNDTLRDEGLRPLHIEGQDQLSWVILDYVNVVAHVFMGPTREYYGLERLWADAPVVVVSDEAS